MDLQQDGGDYSEMQGGAKKRLSNKTHCAPGNKGEAGSCMNKDLIHKVAGIMNSLSRDTARAKTVKQSKKGKKGKKGKTRKRKCASGSSSCKQCNMNDVALIKYDDEALSYVYICCNHECQFYWINKN